MSRIRRNSLAIASKYGNRLYSVETVAAAIDEVVQIEVDKELERRLKDVARVLAKEWREEQKSRSGGVRGGTFVKIRLGAFALLTDLADELNIRPEFDAALAEMEKKHAER